MENNGTLSDEMYTELNKAGFNKSMVDSYLSGVRSEVGYEAAQVTEAPVLSDAEVADVHSIAGGKQGYEQLMHGQVITYRMLTLKTLMKLLKQETKPQSPSQ